MGRKEGKEKMEVSSENLNYSNLMRETKSDLNNDEILTVGEAAALLKKSKRHVYGCWKQYGGVKLGKEIRFIKADLLCRLREMARRNIEEAERKKFAAKLAARRMSKDEVTRWVDSALERAGIPKWKRGRSALREASK